MDKLDPTRAKFLNDNDDPTKKKSKMETDPFNILFSCPPIEIADPKRLNDRNDNEEPRRKKSKTDREFAILEELSLIEIEDPIRRKFT